MTAVLLILLVIIVFALLITARVKIGRAEPFETQARDKKNMSLVKLEDATADAIAQFAEIMARPENTRALGTGESWTREKVDEFVEHARADAAAGVTQYAHWLVLAGSNVVGYVSLRPYTRDELQFRYVIDPAYRGQGYAKWAVSQLARAGHWFVVDPANAASINVARAAGAQPAGHKYIKGKKYNLYRIK